MKVEKLAELSRALAGGKQRGVDARIEVQHEMPELFLPFGWHDLAHRGLWVDLQCGARPAGSANLLRKCCGKPRALLRPRGLAHRSSRAGGINQWADNEFWPGRLPPAAFRVPHQA